MLKITGIVILTILALLTLTIVCNTKYKIEVILEKSKFKYSFKIDLLLGVISIIGMGKGKNMELFIKILFAKKRISNNFKKYKPHKTDNTEFLHNVLNKIKRNYSYKKFIKKIILIIKPKYVKIEGNYGLEDPYITGILGGIFAIIKNIMPKNSINMKPDFFDEVFNVSVEIKGSLKVISFIFIMFRVLMADFMKKKFHRRYRAERVGYEKTSEVKSADI